MRLARSGGVEGRKMFLHEARSGSIIVIASTGWISECVLGCVDISSQPDKRTNEV